jgi:uncharacterized protein (DUF2141 family)
MRSKLLPLALGAAFCLTVGSSRAGADRLTVHVVNLRNDSGQAGCMIFATPDGFPTSPDKALSKQFVKIANKSATCVFDDLRPGTYALVSMHDENGNGKMDFNFVGMPTEGWGTSRDARGVLGPKFEDAAFSYAGGTAELRVSIHY